MTSIRANVIATAVATGAALTAGAALSMHAAGDNSPAGSLSSALTGLAASPFGAIGGAALGFALVRLTPLRHLGALGEFGVIGGIAGGVVGGALLGKAIDRVTHRDWYRDSRDDARDSVDTANDFYRMHGIDDVEVVGHIPITIDRTYRNAGYVPHSWSGEKILIGRYADGTPYTDSPDVLFHEYGHRLINHYAPGLQGEGEDGAIGEGIADTFAVAIDDDDWSIGEGGGTPIRYLDDPARKKYDIGAGPTAYPSTRAEFVTTTADAGGVHINATIVGHASYLIGEAIGRGAMADVYLNALQTGRMRAGMTFDDLAAAAAASAEELWGADSTQHRAVVDAWSTTGYPPSRSGR